jgi:hypothetical protein
MTVIEKIKINKDQFSKINATDIEKISGLPI